MAQRVGRRSRSTPAKKTAKTAKTATATSAAARPRVLGVDVRSADWMPRAARIAEGTARDWVKVPAGDAQRLLRETARLVADLPKDVNQTVVWVAGASELLVHTDRITLDCNAGLVTLGIPVVCDQVAKGAVVTVPLAVGTEKNPRGLFMSTFDTPGGPAAITDVWAGSLTAFAWETLLTLAQQLSRAAGTDPRGRPLVPASIAAARGVLLVMPMARQGS